MHIFVTKCLSWTLERRHRSQKRLKITNMLGKKIYRINSSGHLTLYVIDKVRPPYVISGTHKFKLDGVKAIPARDTELSLTKDEFFQETEQLNEKFEKQELSLAIRIKLITMTDDQWKQLDKQQLLEIKNILNQCGS